MLENVTNEIELLENLFSIEDILRIVELTSSSSSSSFCNNESSSSSARLNPSSSSSHSSNLNSSYHSRMNSSSCKTEADELIPVTVLEKTPVRSKNILFLFTSQHCLCTVVGDYINKMKTTFDLNFDLHQAFKQHGYTKIWEQREAVN